MLPKYEKMTYISTNTLIKPLHLSEKIITIIKERLSHLHWSMFLESASPEHIDSNWSIFTAQPIATLTESNGDVVYDDLINNTTVTMGQDPLAAQMLARQQLFDQNQQHQTEFPFSGGVIAAYHYDMGEIFESLNKQQLNSGLGLGSCHCGFYDWAILYNLKQNQYFLVQQRTKNQQENVNNLWESRYQWLESLSLQVEQETEKFHLSKSWQSNYSEAEYRQSFNKIQD